MSLTKLLVPQLGQMLEGLGGLLDKAEAQRPGAASAGLLAERLAPDMHPLSSQIVFACVQAQEAMYRLGGESLPESLEHLAGEGRAASGQPASLETARDRIRRTVSQLAGLEHDAFDSRTNLSVTVELPNGPTFEMTGAEYVRDWVLPQFYFHLVTAYGILRSRGIDLGKADYVPHMFAHLVPGSRTA